jgi:hypothetical protein
MMLVPEPGPQWPEVAATMLDACEIVLLRPPGRAPAQARQRLETAARRSGAALIVAGTWDGAPMRLHVTRQQWAGIGDGYGRLRARRAEVTAEGRGALVRPLSNNRTASGVSEPTRAELPPSTGPMRVDDYSKTWSTMAACSALPARK